jgi:hypothetical protein
MPNAMKNPKPQGIKGYNTMKTPTANIFDEPAQQSTVAFC